VLVYRVRVRFGVAVSWKKSRNLSGQGKVRGQYFFGKVREKEKLVPPDVRFSGYFASDRKAVMPRFSNQA